MQSDRDNWFGGDLEVDILEEEVPKPKKKLVSLNIGAAYTHALGDCIQSIGVCAAEALIWYTPEWQIADPIATFLFSVLVMPTTIGIVRDSIHILMEGTPDGVDFEEIERGLRRCSAVVDVHDLHIWSLSAAQSSLSVHLVSDDTERALHAAQQYLALKGITHTTIGVVDAKYSRLQVPPEMWSDIPRTPRLVVHTLWFAHLVASISSYRILYT
ncbi:Cation Diffusion Facilitator (CDF) Family [Phytophthora cinnamomi]|uniref:Cation Diffusion Facilitator (CDF) Family n=1 Tax=Phytophthora cinnamomi TaxID=4785 RepID=UPI0035599E11|nr:Cation Diffusion Facilitator (CDF) Family [Phytophthora cinnamomi]